VGDASRRDCFVQAGHDISQVRGEEPRRPPEYVRECVLALVRAGVLAGEHPREPLVSRNAANVGRTRVRHIHQPVPPEQDDRFVGDRVPRLEPAVPLLNREQAVADLNGVARVRQRQENRHPRPSPLPFSMHMDEHDTSALQMVARM